MIAHRDFFIEFRFYSIAPTSGIELNRLFGPNSRPFHFFFLVGFFFIPIPNLSHVPIKGGGLYIPILGAPLPLVEEVQSWERPFQSKRSIS